jgi:hypothetical protein
MFFQCVVETVGEIRHADHAKFLELRGANSGSAARHAVRVENRRSFLLIKQRTALAKRQCGNLFRSDPGVRGRGNMRPRSIRGR